MQGYKDTANKKGKLNTHSHIGKGGWKVCRYNQIEIKLFNSIKIELLHVFTTRGVKLNSRRRKKSIQSKKSYASKNI